jgi:hypothetical protein
MFDLGGFMGKKNVYYLVGRDPKSNQFEIINISDKRGNSLEEIDLYTTSFGDCRTMSNFLLDQGLICDGYMDYFIVHQSKYHGKSYLHTDEVLYASTYEIRDIARSSMKGNIKEEERKINSILNSFCFQMKSFPKFYDMVVYEKTNLYSKFVRYFVDKRFIDAKRILYQDGGWVRESYPLIRNIVETLGRSYSIKSVDVSSRDAIKNQLLEITDKDYDPFQISLFEGEEDGYQKNKRDRGIK